MPVDESANIGLELPDGGMNTSPEPFSGGFGEPAFDLIDPRRRSNANRRSRAALSEDQFVLTLTGPKMIAWPDRSAGVRGELAQRAALQHFVALANRPSRPPAF
jgi:hypothetical protein